MKVYTPQGHIIKVKGNTISFSDGNTEFHQQGLKLVGEAVAPWGGCDCLYFTDEDKQLYALDFYGRKLVKFGRAPELFIKDITDDA